jgi:hypothetical protein
VERLIEDWDDTLAARTFAMNVELDEPLTERRAEIERIRQRHGPLRPDETEEPESQTAYHLAWWLKGDRGRVRVEILLSPELPPKVQTMNLTSVPEAPAELAHAAELIAAALDHPVVDWPAELALAEELDAQAVLRALRATEARFAPTTLGPPIEGDGVRRATFRLHSARGRLDLALDYDAAARCVSRVALIPARQVPPDLD